MCVISSLNIPLTLLSCKSTMKSLSVFSVSVQFSKDCRGESATTLSSVLYVVNKRLMFVYRRESLCSYWACLCAIIKYQYITEIVELIRGAL